MLDFKGFIYDNNFNRNGKEGQLARCDFCALKYHLSCLNPPLCSMPPRDRLWMCPNHVENFLDQNILTTSRLSERIKLWNKYSFSKTNLDSVKIDFINKCNQLRENKSSQNEIENGNNIKSRVYRCSVPDVVKFSYKKSNQQVMDIEEDDERVEIEEDLTNEKMIESRQNQTELNYGREKVSPLQDNISFIDENEKESVSEYIMILTFIYFTE